MDPLNLVNLLPQDNTSNNILDCTPKPSIMDALNLMNQTLYLLNQAINLYDTLDDAEEQVVAVLRSISDNINKIVNIFGGNGGFVGKMLGQEGNLVAENNRKKIIEWIFNSLVNILTEYAQGYQNIPLWIQDLMNMQKTLEILFMTKATPDEQNIELQQQ